MSHRLLFSSSKGKKKTQARFDLTFMKCLRGRDIEQLQQAMRVLRALFQL